MASFSGAVSFLLAGRTQLLGRVHSVNKENNVYKDAIGVKGLGVKHHGNHPGNHGYHYGNYHDNHSYRRGNYHAELLLFSC